MKIETCFGWVGALKNKLAPGIVEVKNSEPKCDEWGIDEEMDKAVDELVEAAYKRMTVYPLTRKVTPQKDHSCRP